MTDLVVLAHGHARWVLPLDLLPWHPLAGVVRRWQRPGGVWCGVLSLLWWELTIRSVLLTHVTCLDKDGEREKKRLAYVGCYMTHRALCSLKRAQTQTSKVSRCKHNRAWAAHSCELLVHTGRRSAQHGSMEYGRAPVMTNTPDVFSMLEWTGR